MVVLHIQLEYLALDKLEEGLVQLSLPEFGIEVEQQMDLGANCTLEKVLLEHRKIMKLVLVDRMMELLVLVGYRLAQLVLEPDMMVPTVQEDYSLELPVEEGNMTVLQELELASLQEQRALVYIPLLQL